MDCMQKTNNKIFSKKNLIIGISSLVVIGAIFGESEPADETKTLKTNTTEVKQEAKQVDICDGKIITKDCELDGVEYSIYKYFLEVAEVSHIETKTTYTKEIVGYCTSCNDGTRSPSCSTGSGTCSHHGGVDEWNAPIYRDVPKYEQIKVIDSEAIEARYEKVVK